MAKAIAGSFKVSVPRHLAGKVLDKGSHDGVTGGRTTGLRITHYADALLLANEQHKATDEVLNEMLLAEFDKRQTKESGVQGVPTVQSISAYRAYFNAGKHGHNSRLSSPTDGAGRKLDHSSSYNAEGVARCKPSPAPKGKGKGKAAKGKPAKAAKGKGKPVAKPAKATKPAKAGTAA